MKTLFRVLAIAALVTLPIAAQDSNVPSGIEGIEGVVDLGTDPTSFDSDGPRGRTDDCEECYRGLGNSRIDFALTQTRDMRVRIWDCCLLGDRYEVRVNDEQGGSPDEDCIVARQDSTAPLEVWDEFDTFTLLPGSYSLRIRDVAFQCDARDDRCPAGYGLQILWDDPTGSAPPQCLGCCTDILTQNPSCQDQCALFIPVGLERLDVE